MLDWQASDFRALDRAWMELSAIPQRRRLLRADAPMFQRAYLERPRGHSKTFDTAVHVAWILMAAQRAVRGLCAAADLEQGLLVHDSMSRLAQANKPLLGGLAFRTARVLNPKTNSRVDFVSSDVASSWGHDPDFVICDELCHWEKAGMWHSLLSSAAKRPHCVLLVLSNAGAGRDWHWDVREAARQDPRWYFSTLAGPQVPWITAEHLAEQQRMLPRSTFERVWLNIWQHSDGEFVTLAEAEACRDSCLTIRERGLPQFSYVGAVDYAEKHDLTVGCLCHREGDRVIVDRMDVVRPTSLRPTPVQWVADWIERMARDFRSVRFVVDDFQLVGVVQRLEQRHLIQRFSFAGGKGNHALALLLRRLIVERQVAWYPGCGAASGADGERDDLETELAGLLVCQKPGGYIRINHVADGRHHDDRSFALGAACVELCSGAGGEDFLEIRGPRDDGRFDL
jgi:hypothetical protein